jgi:hypothetical protein
MREELLHKKRFQQDDGLYNNSKGTKYAKKIIKIYKKKIEDYEKEKIQGDKRKTVGLYRRKDEGQGKEIS